MRRLAVDRLAWDRMADGAAAAIHVNPEHAGEQASVDDLSVVAVGAVAIRPVKKSIFRMEKHAAAVMPDGVAFKIHQHNFRFRDSHTLCVQREA